MKCPSKDSNATKSFTPVSRHSCEGEKELAKVVERVALGTHVEASRLLAREFLRDKWLPAIAHTVRPTTYVSYEGHINNYITPEFGEVPLGRLSPVMINAFYAKTLTEGRISREKDKKNAGRRPKPLAPASVRRMHATLHRALKDAVRWNLIGCNPADAADPPRVAGCGGAKVEVWSLTDLRKFLACQKGNDLYPLWLLFLTTGVRRGEALGLRWQDVDLVAATMGIVQTRVRLSYRAISSTPKTQKGCRLVALDPATVAVLAALKEKRKKDKTAVGQELDETEVVFLSGHGEPLHPERATRLFKKAIKNAQVPMIRLHDLRHTHAMLALCAGVHPKVVSERLGHANIGITLDTYSHCLPALSEEAARRVAALVISGDS